MDASLTQSPFVVVTFIVAPAMLTNASSVLAMSTINRMLRSRDRMAQLNARSEAGGLSEMETQNLLRQVARVEQQGLLLLTALRSIYLALGAFAAATLATLLAAVLEQFHVAFWFHTLTTVGLALGCLGVTGLISGSLRLFRATKLALANIRDDAAMIRERQEQRTSRSESMHP
jgi:hypothetical protein